MIDWRISNDANEQFCIISFTLYKTEKFLLKIYKVGTKDLVHTNFCKCDFIWKRKNQN